MNIYLMDKNIFKFNTFLIMTVLGYNSN
jgi:hypothetical protein